MKKEYIRPSIKVANIDSADIICTSGNINYGYRYESGYNDYIGIGDPWEGDID